MAAEITASVKVELTGLGKGDDFVDLAVDGATPTISTGKQIRTLDTADTEEALDVAGITTAAILVIRAIDYDLDVDLDFVSSFNVNLTVKAGEPAALVPNPAGIVYVKNNGAAETPSYEFILIGT